MSRFFNIIGWIGTALVLAAVGLKYGIRPEWQQYSTYTAWAGLALVLVYMAGQWRDVADFYKGRGARYGTLSLVSILVFVGILIAVNYLSTRQNKRWDLTANQVYSLSDQTVKILTSLGAPVKFTVFDQEVNFDRFRDRLEAYTYHSNKVSTEYVDMDKNPTRTKAAQVQAYGTILVEYKDRTERVSTLDEQNITNALIKAVTGQAKKVYFTSGHGEKDPTSPERAGYNGVEQALTRDNYSVSKLVIVQTGSVPDDATVVVIAGPKTDFLQPEIDALRKYVGKGGKVMVMMDPPEKSGEPELALLTGFLHDWGIQAGKDVVLDASGIGQLLGTDASVPVAASYPPHPITNNFTLMTAYPLARSMTAVEGGVNGHIPQTVVETSPQSWAEANVDALLKGDGRVAFNADQGDKQGPITLGVAVTGPATDAPAPPAPKEGEKPGETPPKPETRIFAIGDSEFASNSALGIQGNRDFFLNAVNWLAQQDTLIAIRAREPEDRRLTLTSDQQNRIFLLSIFLIPGFVFASGVWTWWRRR